MTPEQIKNIEQKVNEDLASLNIPVGEGQEVTPAMRDRIVSTLIDHKPRVRNIRSLRSRNIHERIAV